MIFDPGSHEVVHIGTKLPGAVADWLPEDFVEAFETDQGFCPFSGLSSACAALASDSYRLPVLHIRWIRPNLPRCSISVEGDQGVLWGGVHSRATIELTPISLMVSSLPSEFQCYYRWLDGMQLVTDSAGPSLAWRDLPISFGGRRELAEVCAGREISKVYRSLESKSLLVWMAWRTGDLFFADEYQPQAKLFHTNENTPGVVHGVKPGFLDAYLGHYFARWAATGFPLEDWLEKLNT